MDKRTKSILASLGGLSAVTLAGFGHYLESPTLKWVGYGLLVCLGIWGLYALARRADNNDGPDSGPGAYVVEGEIVSDHERDFEPVTVRPGVLPLDSLLEIINSASEDPDLRNTKSRVVAKVAIVTAQRFGYDTNALLKQAEDLIRLHNQDAQRLEEEINQAAERKDTLIRQANSEYTTTESQLRSEITDLNKESSRLTDLFFPQGLPTLPPEPPPVKVYRVGNSQANTAEES